MSNTKAELIEAARKLFASKGVDSTTMNEIAELSGKGRRTLYTYFKSKTEIYMAVLEQETNHIIEHTEEILNLQIPADEKLKLYILVRLDTVKETVVRNGSLKAAFFRDVVKLEHARRKLDTRELSFLRSILQQGIDEGTFDIDNASVVAVTIHYALRGLDIPNIRGQFTALGVPTSRLRQSIFNMIFYGIVRQPHPGGRSKSNEEWGESKG
ncbi:MAG: TetR/AcrR family transcriptional regulator [Bacteroidales bacterium]|nr:TetR/AcrR family transcriptional regulator [Bacteroidales bacterium]